MKTCSAARNSARPVTRDREHEPQRHRDQQPFEADGLAERGEHDEHGEVAGELQRERRRDRRVDDELVRERDLADQPGVAGEADRRALQAFLRREPRPQRDGDEQQEALAAEARRRGRPS